MAGTTTTDALLGIDGSRLGLTVGATSEWYLFSPHGDISAEVASSGAVAGALRYDPYGQVVAQAAGGLASPWADQGALDLSPSTDPLDAMGSRDYAPSLGAWTSADSSAGAAVDPLSLDRFLYVEADPTSGADPTGQCYVSSLDAVMPGPCPGANPAVTVSTRRTVPPPTPAHVTRTGAVAGSGTVSPAGGAVAPTRMTFSVVQFGQARVVVGPDGAPITPSGDRLMQGICDELPGSAASVAACAADARYWKDQRTGSVDTLSLVAGMLHGISSATGVAALTLAVVGAAGGPVPPVFAAVEGTATVLTTVSVVTGRLATVIECYGGHSTSCALGLIETGAGGAGLGGTVAANIVGASQDVKAAVELFFDFVAAPLGLAGDAVTATGR